MTHLAFRRVWAIYKKDIFDLTDLIYSIGQSSGGTSPYSFLDSDIVDVFKQQAGQDITSALNTVLATKDSQVVAQNMNCLQNAFFVGKTDVRKSPRCQVQNYFLLVASGILMGTMVIKCE